MSEFHKLISSPALLQRLSKLGYHTPTPIQEAAIPRILTGEDLMAAAPTGTGKTAAFMLPTLELLEEHPRIEDEDGYILPRLLIIAPTRELAQQLAANFRDYGRNCGQRCLLICGGQRPQDLQEKLRQGADAVVATPGRLYELMLTNQVDFDYLQCLILDEADRLLDLGFADDLQLIVKRLPQKRQNLLFSATFDKAVRELATELMPNAVELGQKDANRASTSVRQWLHPVDHTDKGNAVVTLLQENRWPQAMVFTKTKKGADGLIELLKSERIQAEVLHGDKTQSERNRILDAFREHKLRVLVTTDVASRGIDIEHLPVVINHDLPPVAHDYIHRIGRTGRAGEKGIAISLVAAHEVDTLTEIETLIGRVLPREDLIGHVPNHNVPETGPGKFARKKKPVAKKKKGNSAQPEPEEKQLSSVPRANRAKEKPKAPPVKEPKGRGGSLLGRKGVTKRSID
ncbi:MAG: DEAD/DEAH box helicase [Thalassolituus sp.]